LQNCGVLVGRASRLASLPSSELHADLTTRPQLGHRAENDGDGKENENSEAKENPHTGRVAFKASPAERNLSPGRMPQPEKEEMNRIYVQSRRNIVF